jgi:hypothetical protein
MPDSKRFPIEAFEDVLAANSKHAAAYEVSRSSPASTPASIRSAS